MKVLTILSVLLLGRNAFSATTDASRPQTYTGSYAIIWFDEMAIGAPLGSTSCSYDQVTQITTLARQSALYNCQAAGKFQCKIVTERLRENGAVSYEQRTEFGQGGFLPSVFWFGCIYDAVATGT